MLQRLGLCVLLAASLLFAGPSPTASANGGKVTQAGCTSGMQNYWLVTNGTNQAKTWEYSYDTCTRVYVSSFWGAFFSHPSSVSMVLSGGTCSTHRHLNGSSYSSLIVRCPNW